MEVGFIFTWHLTPWEQAHYEVVEVAMVEHGTAIKATTIILDATIALAITNMYQLKTIPYLHVLQFVQHPIIV